MSGHPLLQFPVAELVTLSEDVENKNIWIEDLKNVRKIR